MYCDFELIVIHEIKFFYYFDFFLNIFCRFNSNIKSLVFNILCGRSKYYSVVNGFIRRAIRFLVFQLFFCRAKHLIVRNGRFSLCNNFLVVRFHMLVVRSPFLVGQLNPTLKNLDRYKQNTLPEFQFLQK